MPTFTIGEHDFMLDGQPHRILSGALHYFRVHPDQWADRIRKARQMGLNTIETYIPWNAHAPSPEVFENSGVLDLGRFLDLVAAEGMQAIVRPGPYICAEWDNGGLPAWLFSTGATEIRADEPVYMAAVSTYFEQLAPILVPRQVQFGGPIILIQIENEYGAYGDDSGYLEKLVKINREIGLTVPFTTVDQPQDDMLENGSLPGLHRTGSFGSRAAERLDTLRRHQPTGPLMCSEFWVGWFDHWGAHHHTTSVEESAKELEELLGRGASVNIYMFHGGTNFGFSNGANDKGVYQPLVTSYDYDAPLDEAGNPTSKYWAFRSVLARYADLDDRDVPALPAPAPALTIPLSSMVPLWNLIDRAANWVTSDGGPPVTDEIGHYSGFSLYRTRIDAAGTAVLGIEEVRDRAQVFLNRQGVGTLSRDHHERALALPFGASGTLEILVEDQGRVNYGHRLGEKKGLIGEVTINGEAILDWDLLPLDLNNIGEVAAHLGGQSPERPVALAGPAFAYATFDRTEVSDLFLDTSGWGKGVVWINGFCLGRYWSRGPQHTLYVPGPVVRAHGNEIIILELHGSTAPVVSFVPAANLGHTDF
ncbi:beta-galactosidase [Arthrobacter sp. ERGS1:01]|uniref:glycoside hydrolase family 35 protein n=1 Tax=Arthrobacter sp. ERGS1:01 TaxID=1704044 RepID=UPI0006B69B76|nr:beta-galactosidase family protein [Arthrobacter sp. ERGS1:01]ALE05743.1 beta-galactosidase [Arthrobacter sp. ERGS1:01]